MAELATGQPLFQGDSEVRAACVEGRRLCGNGLAGGVPRIPFPTPLVCWPPSPPAFSRVSVPLPILLQIGQLLAIFQVLGTPSDEQWPGVSALPDWQPHFPQWRPRDLAEVCVCVCGPCCCCCCCCIFCFCGFRGRIAARPEAAVCLASPADRHRCSADAVPLAILLQVVPGLDALGLDLLSQMLCFEPSKRIRCRQALAHPWFDDIRWVRSPPAHTDYTFAHDLPTHMPPARTP